LPLPFSGKAGSAVIDEGTMYEGRRSKRLRRTAAASTARPTTKAAKPV
jgi:hypothetical protein